MSGHSKFANIKHKKEKNDAAKGKIFTRLGREIAVAVKEGGPDVNNNSKLKDIVAKAKSNNMPNETIERSIKKAAGDAGNVNYEFVSYEGYGPSGTAIIVEALTDNKNRTAANVRNAFTKGGGNVGTQGCVSFMFDTKGQIIIDKEECAQDADELMMIALDAGADDLANVGGGVDAAGDQHALKFRQRQKRQPLGEHEIKEIQLQQNRRPANHFHINCRNGVEGTELSDPPLTPAHQRHEGTKDRAEHDCEKSHEKSHPQSLQKQLPVLIPKLKHYIEKFHPV